MMTHHENLAQADRLIADCMDRIARQREVIITKYGQGFPTDVANGCAGTVHVSDHAIAVGGQYLNSLQVTNRRAALPAATDRQLMQTPARSVPQPVQLQFEL
jgi:hypothetical protein